MNLWALFRRDIHLAWAAGGGGPVGVIFFLAVTAVAPFAVGPDLPLLARLGPALLWIAVLLALLLGLERLFQADEEDGTLDQLRLSDVPLGLVVLTKAAAHWSAAALPLIIATPFAAILLNMSPGALGVTLASFLIGTPGLALIGAVGAAVAVSLRRAGVLIAILVLPLSIPSVIFGVAACEAFAAGRDPSPQLAMLGAITLIFLVLAPIAAAAALKEID
ncbi:heme exporter protein CcmB [Acuticoccus sp. MNP-M23]|uniref:heme exporter protein CcmB n=1 Tax=Acuticoccus sp. MNP-M23 TaxID=3072793 RepID=UPI002815DD7F|nr:heme exporter protein CcmB [Acuticoccus sp. MNP-M23]WMS41083.1 heme exporter protein CcmB [Acuticoccus sp. MNP-M23]